MDTIEQCLRRVLKTRGTSDVHQRIEIYRSAYRAIDRAQSRSKYGDPAVIFVRFQRSIENIESEFGNNKNKIPLTKLFLYDYEKKEENGTINISIKLISIFALTAIIFFVYFKYLSPHNYIVIKHIDFGNLSENYSSSPLKIKDIHDQEAIFLSSDFENYTTLIVKGKAQIFFREPIFVSKDNSYKMSIMVRIISDDENKTKTSMTYSGLSTYDDSGKLLTSEPGTHRYGVVRRKISSKEGWQTFSGTFRGRGDGGHNMIRNGTKTVRPVVLVNYPADEGVKTEIAWIKIERLVD